VFFVCPEESKLLCFRGIRTSGALNERSESGELCPIVLNEVRV